MRIAFFSPLNPRRSGISDYSEELLPYLAQHAEIDLFVDGYTPSNGELTANFAVYDQHRFEALRQPHRYDVALYQMGNSLAHEYIYRLLGRFPGVTVLHDYILHHLIAGITVGRDDHAAYVRELGYCHGLAGAMAASTALREGPRFPYLEFPANRRAIEASFGLIVHNDYMRSLLVGDFPGVPLAKISHHYLLPETGEDTPDPRRSLGIEDEAVVFTSFGLATPEKRLDLALRAFRLVRELLPDSRFLIVGEVPSWYDLREKAREIGTSEGVEFVGYVAKEDLSGYIAATDVGISLRWPTMGETSGSLLRLLGAGRATIVSKVGSYAEYPDDCCIKIPVGEDEEDQLVSAMLSMGRDSQRRESLGRRAREHIVENHSIESSAAQYIEFIESILR